jgi:hypothetical protein
MLFIYSLLIFHFVVIFKKGRCISVSDDICTLDKCVYFLFIEFLLKNLLIKCMKAYFSVSQCPISDEDVQNQIANGNIQPSLFFHLLIIFFFFMNILIMKR